MGKSIFLLTFKTLLDFFKKKVFFQIKEPGTTQSEHIHVDGTSTSLYLRRLKNNPILGPIAEHPWESRAVFNPAVVFEAGKVHFVYRAVGESGISVFGYANSLDGVNVHERLKQPIYAPVERPCGGMDLKNYASGPGFAGCEDPRITKIGDRLYMTYTILTGYEAPRVALTSIKVEDFLNKNWNWRYPVIISPPGEMHKNWVIFPEKIKGKYAILHSISPNILVDYFDSLEFDGAYYIQSYWDCGNRDGCWDNKVRGVGSPPIKTSEGWLIFYHAMDNDDPGRYKVGSMLLDLNDPTKILYRSAQPVLEPDANYENEGFKAGVVYVCGATVLDEEKLIIYYGGADTVVCGATSNFKEFLAQLKTQVINLDIK